MSLQQAALQALEALEEQVRRIGPEFDDPFAYGLETDRWALMRKAIPALRAALAEPENQSQSQIDTKVNPAEPEQEPVAWAFRYDDGTYHDPSVTEHSPGMVPLCPCTAPTPRKPLTDEQIVTMYAENPSSDAEMIEFARAIERAHGIGGGE